MSLQPCGVPAVTTQSWERLQWGGRAASSGGGVSLNPAGCREQNEAWKPDERQGGTLAGQREERDLRDASVRADPPAGDALLVKIGELGGEGGLQLGLEGCGGTCEEHYSSLGPLSGILGKSRSGVRNVSPQLSGVPFLGEPC